MGTFLVYILLALGIPSLSFEGLLWAFDFSSDKTGELYEKFLLFSSYSI
jgi:hypothetical protein